MEIQKLLFPQIGRCTEKELYFRLNKDKDFLLEEKKAFYYSNKQVLLFNCGGLVWFDTYFNSFSAEKWFKYTVIKNVSLKIKLSGRFRIILLTKEKVQNTTAEKIVFEKIVEAEEAAEFVCPFENCGNNGMYTFGLQALSDGSVYYGGAYCADVESGQIRDVKIGIGICTFKREKFIENNLNILKESILENKSSVLNQKIEIFISDNGQSLEKERLETDKIHIYPNRNLGGAGGFTRNLIEIMEHNKDFQITHILLMDDDIVIEPESLVRTYILLSLVKEEYKDAFIGGAMLRLDIQYLQVEAGASWNGGQLVSLKHGLDLRKCEACLYNEIEEYTEFNAWWYCCFPADIVKPDNLPLPIFIRGDDLEYGLRNMKKLILLNGICVWHEPFENKYSSYLEYYIIRNQLIDNSFHCQWYGMRNLSKTMFKHCIQEIMFYRYKNVELYLQGIKDFLKGPEWLAAQDGEVLHKSIMAQGYKGIDLDQLPIGFNYPIYAKSLKCKNTLKTKIRRNLSFNGLFLPAKGNNIVNMSFAKTPMFYRKKRVMHYDEAAKKAFITERSVMLSLKYIIKTTGMLFVIMFRLKNAQKKYRTDGLELRKLEFWKQYLEI